MIKTSVGKQEPEAGEPGAGSQDFLQGAEAGKKIQGAGAGKHYLLGAGARASKFPGTREP